MNNGAGPQMNLPYVGEITSSFDDLNTASKQAKALQRDIKRMVAEGQKMTPQLQAQFLLAERTLKKVKQLKQNEAALKSAIKDVKLLQYYATTSAVRNILSGNAGAADIIPLLSHERVGKTLTRVGLGKFASAAMRVALPAQIAAEATQAVFNKLIESQDLRRDTAKYISKNIDLSRELGVSPRLRNDLMRSFEADAVKKGGFVGLVKTQVLRGLGMTDQQQLDVTKQVTEALTDIKKGRGDVELITGRSEHEILRAAANAQQKTVAELTMRERETAIAEAMLPSYMPGKIEGTRALVANTKKMAEQRRLDEERLIAEAERDMTPAQLDARRLMVRMQMARGNAPMWLGRQDNIVTPRTAFAPDDYNVLLNTKVRSKNGTKPEWAMTPGEKFFAGIQSTPAETPTTPIQSTPTETPTKKIARQIDGVWRMVDAKAAEQDLAANQYNELVESASRPARLINDRLSEILSTTPASPKRFRADKAVSELSESNYQRTGPVSKD